MKQASNLLNTFLSESLKSMDRLSDCVRAYLLITSDEPFIQAVPRHNRLAIVTDSALLASQLRYQQQPLLKHVNKEMLTAFRHIDIRISPASYKKMQEIENKEPLKNETRQFIDMIAGSIDDEALADSLKRLGSNYRRMPNK